MARKYKEAALLKVGEHLVISGSLLEIKKIGKPIDYGTLSKKKVINIWVKGRSRPYIYYVDTKLEWE